MDTSCQNLADDTARRAAICQHDQSFLVEAGAGSGKTAVMAGRVASMIAEGAAPSSIAAVTFTELAASELLARIRGYVTDLAKGDVAPELHVAFPDGLSPSQLRRVTDARTTIDEITCTTIHGFCQRLIQPYPVEANLDPGATVMDADEAALAFAGIIDLWLRERLSGGATGVLGELVLADPDEAIRLVRTIAERLRSYRDLTAPPQSPLTSRLASFRRAVDEFAGFLHRSQVSEPDTEAIAARFAELAAALPAVQKVVTPAALVGMLVLHPHRELCTQKGEFRRYQKKGKWSAAAKRAGRKGDAVQLNNDATDRYAACCDAWNALRQALASHVLAMLLDEVRPILDRYQNHKRKRAQLDFDDLIYSARDLLRDHDDVRRALGLRFAHVLVDEFQDTDALQTEIFWRLCGEPVDDPTDWRGFRIRAGALFLVGDPKQAIYRFRGADVEAYLAARDVLQARDAQNVLPISTNFRSRPAILDFVNERFQGPLSDPGQPGFTELTAFHDNRDEVAHVAAFDVAIASGDGKATAEQQRDAEAEAIAGLCTRLIGDLPVLDPRSSEDYFCRPGDIALLAPTGTDLWRYEEALERQGIAVASQAGKGFFRRQEVHDLIALTRVLADRRDRLALGALLRGPLVGLTEEELLDIVAALPRPDDDADRIPQLDLNVDAAAIGHPLARDLIERLQALHKQASSTTPYALLSRAVDVLRVRPIVRQRHRGQAERALANINTV